MTTSSIQKTVMRRVRTIYALRIVTSPLIVAPALFLFSLWGVGREVWFARIVENISFFHTPEGIAMFLLQAFVSTRVVVQVLTLTTFFAGFWFVYGIQRISLTSNTV